MTLNIALVSRAAAYLCADFRLTLAAGYQDDLKSQKLLVINKYRWCALIAFNGAANLDSRYVGDWLAEQTRADQPQEKLQDVVNRLCTADEWLARRRGGGREFSITMVGFEARRPFRYLLSNYQEPSSKMWKGGAGSMRAYRARPRDAELLVLPDKNLLTAEERESLRTMFSRDPRDDTQIAEALAAINAEVNRRGAPVSPQCIIAKVLPTGEGWISPFGIDTPKHDYIPSRLERELISVGAQSLKRKADADGNPLPIIWKKTAFHRQTINGLGNAIFAAEFANVEEVSGEPRRNTSVFSGIAKGGPTTLQLQISTNPRKDGSPPSAESPTTLSLHLGPRPKKQDESL